MAKKELTVRQWLAAWDRGDFRSPDVDTMIKAGWYDWFCRPSSLKRRLEVMVPKIRQLAASPKVDQDKMYVFFKNNCPVMGTLYDDFRFCDMKTGDVIWCVVPRSGFDSDEGKRSRVAGKSTDYQDVVQGKWKDVVKFFFPDGK